MSQELVLASAIYCILSNSFENSAKYKYCIKKVWFVSCSIYTHRQIIRHDELRKQVRLNRRIMYGI